MVSILCFMISTDRRTGPLCIFQMALSRVNTRVFLFLFFFPPFSGGLPRVNTKVFLFYFYFSPFSSGFAVYDKTGLCIFQMALHRVNTRVFFFFLSPFSSGLPKVNTRVLLLLLLFSPLTDGPTQIIAF
jgi:hypothetical protein